MKGNSSPVHGIASVVKQIFTNTAIEINNALNVEMSGGWVPAEYSAMEDHGANLSVSLTLSVIGCVDHADLEIAHCRICHGDIIADTGDADWMHIHSGPDGDEVDRLRMVDCPHCLQQIDQEWELIDGQWKSRQD